MTIDDFAGFGLADPLTAALAKHGFTAPTPVQSGAIPPQLEGRDVLAIAQTGTGKTAAFTLPLLHHLAAERGRPAPRTARVLILAPTRELAVQIDETAAKLSGDLRISRVLVLGGMPRNKQVRALERGADIVIATPGRLNDLADEGHIDLSQTRQLVLDEADRMLDSGFLHAVRALVRQTHRDRRTALLSATMPAEIERFAAELLRDPVRVEVAPPGETVQRIDQSVELHEHGAKRARLVEILSDPAAKRVIVFTRTKRGADRVAGFIEKAGIAAQAIHGNKSQNARQRALNGFREGSVNVLVASDIASRGIDVRDITHVVQYELPDEPEAYVHRIGRTGRSGAEGVAIALCSPEEVSKLRAIEKLTRLRLLDPDVKGVDAKPKARRGGQNRKGPRPQQAANGNASGGKPGGQGKPRRPRRRRAA